MKCCNRETVYTLSGKEELCKLHFIRYFEKKVRKTIRICRLIGKEERLGIVASNGINSLVLLELLNKITKDNRKIKLISINKTKSTFSDLIKKLKLTKLAISHNLDYEAQSIILKQIDGNFNDSFGISSNLIIRPLFFCSDREIELYAKFNNIKGKKAKLENKRAKIAKMINKFESKFPGTKNSIVNSAID